MRFLFRCAVAVGPRRRRRVSIFLVLGQKGFEIMTASINPGQTKMLVAVYTDANGNTDPLASLPVPTDKSGAVTAFTPCDANKNPSRRAGRADGERSELPVAVHFVRPDRPWAPPRDLSVTVEGDPTPGADTIVKRHSRRRHRAGRYTGCAVGRITPRNRRDQRERAALRGGSFFVCPSLYHEISWRAAAGAKLSKCASCGKSYL